MAKTLKQIYALKDEKIVNIDDVESGKICNCICPACREPLIAKKGNKQMHHFAHAPNTNCEYGYESSLHLAAKDILSKAKEITIPAVYVKFPDSYKEDELICNAKTIDIDHVELEQHYSDIIPDIVVYSGKKKFFIEIYVTHTIDDEKLKKLKNAGISTIEIDLSKKDKTISANELKKILLDDSPEKQWKYNILSEKYLNKFIEYSDEKELSTRGFAMQIDNCPIRMRVWKGKFYANLIDDCLYCKYCISNGEKILCSGRKRVATIQDFKISEEQRIKISNEKINNEKSALLIKGICPNCGGRLTRKNGKNGVFLGCSNFPHCRFTAAIDFKYSGIQH